MVEAYSRLDQILRARNLTVSELHRKMRDEGFSTNLKSLYRLADPHQALERLDLRLAGAICRAFGVELTDLISFQAPSGQLRHLSRVKQRRLDELMDKNNNGALLADERAELEGLVRDAEEVTLANARLLAEQHSRLSKRPVA
jgi:hypothetical protein